jgi:hypothetical protein
MQTTDGVRLRRARVGHGHLRHGAVRHGSPGFKTAQAFDADDRSRAGITVHAAPDVGDDVGQAYQFEAIPDGHLRRPIAQRTRARLYVNHETSKVPFPYNPATDRPSR